MLYRNRLYSLIKPIDWLIDWSINWLIDRGSFLWRNVLLFQFLDSRSNMDIWNCRTKAGAIHCVSENRSPLWLSWWQREMKTNLNNMWHECSWRNLQQNFMERMLGLFVEHHYFKFQDENEIHIFQYNNVTLKHRCSEKFHGCNKPMSCFFKSCNTLLSFLPMLWRNIICLPFPLTSLSRWVRPKRVVW